MRTSIDISKLKRSTKIIVETEVTVFEIVVTGPKSGSVSVTGGTRFVRPTKAKIVSLVQKRRPIVFMFKNEQGKDDSLTSTQVLSATVYASDGSWHYDAIEKKDKRK
tara:strand:+ start:58 stop:378 length:321 start_codon:yes stop_codon:yes gene_type:complete